MREVGVFRSGKAPALTGGRFTTALVASVAVALAGGCTRGTRKPGEPRKPKTTAETVAAPLDDWEAGRLPASVLEGTPRDGGTLVVRAYAEPPSLDKITDSDYLTTIMLDGLVLESLAEQDRDRHPDYPLRPALAESWDISPDGLTFTFRLRRGVKWHDGRPFTSADVVATVRKILEPGVRSMHLRNNLEALESIDAPDPHTVVVRYKEPYFMAFRWLASTMKIYPKHLLDVAGDLLSHPIHRAPVGTGPFRFLEWRTADRIVFERNPDYRGPKARLDRVVWRIVADDVVAFQLLQKGEFDLFLRASAQSWAVEMPRVPAIREQYHRIKYFSPNYSFIGWNNRRPLFADPRVRRALSMLIDKEGVRQRFLFGVDEPVTCHFFRESSACDSTLTPLPYDPVAARALLDEAGWIDRDGDGLREKDGVPAAFTFLLPSSSIFGGRLASWMQQELGRNGIRLEVKKIEWSVYSLKLREHDFDVCMLGWANNDVVSDAYQVWHSSQAEAGSNYVSYSNPEADRLILEARGTLDDDSRNALFRRFGRLLADDAPYTFLFTRPNLDLVKRHVRGLKPSIVWYNLHEVWLAAEGR